MQELALEPLSGSSSKRSQVVADIVEQAGCRLVSTKPTTRQGTKGGRVPMYVLAWDEVMAEALADVTSETKSDIVYSMSASSHGYVYAPQNCVLQRKTQCFVCYDIAMCEGWGSEILQKGCPHAIQIPLPALQRSAKESDCQICHVFWDALEPLVESSDEDIMTRAVLVTQEGSWWVRVFVEDYAPEPKSHITPCHQKAIISLNRRKKVYEAHLFTPSGHGFQSWFSRTVPQSIPIQQHTDSATSHAIMRAWLSDCLQNHDECKDPVKILTTSGPDRLVHIVAKSCIRLSTRHPPNTPYLALSYCWGVPDVFSTTNENLIEHLEGIPVSKLPKTFRDALAITQALGYEYIWIDSLCILQGDKGDFAHQSGQMGDIYSNADLVLSADLAKNVHEGFLHERTPASFAIEIPLSKCNQHQHNQRKNENESISSEDSSHMERCTADNIKTIFVYPVQVGNDGPHTSPTCERAWCFQEQLLACRLIHFTKDSMYWKCRAHSRCECGVTDKGKHMHEVQDRYTRRPLESYANSEERSSVALIEEMRHWSHVVDEYSERKLTNPTDRLPAIAGFASRLQSPTLGEYHAGLWKNSLPSALLWGTGSSITMPETHAYIGPTWSWISSTKGSTANSEEMIDLAKVLEVRTYRESSETYGSIRASWIRLLGIVRRANTVGSLIHGLSMNYEWSTFKVRKRRDRRLQAIVSWDSTQHTFARPAMDIRSEFYFLLIGLSHNGESHTPKGLVLVKSPEQPGAFERVGKFFMTSQLGHGWKQKVVTII